MVIRLGFLVSCLFALVAVACGGGGGGSPAQTSVKPTATPARVSIGPRAEIEPNSGPPGTEVIITGTGWTPNAHIDLMADVARGETSPSYGSITTDAQGGFTYSFRLEKGIDGNTLPVGRFDLIAKSGDDQVDIPFLVETRRPVPSNGPGG
ncbi:MAG TPA: hypothetical protein VFX19_04510 [Dehalococcoidia bacterium]|jgi:hypothetical protein|nr:hypothetical protein [Dehalococcoidia bacterium]